MCRSNSLWWSGNPNLLLLRKEGFSSQNSENKILLQHYPVLNRQLTRGCSKDLNLCVVFANLNLLQMDERAG